MRPADGHDFVLQRLAQHFQHTYPEFGQFIQKWNTVMGQRNFLRMWPIAAAYRTGVADGMVGEAEWVVAQQWCLRRELVGHGIDAGHVQRLINGHFQQDARQVVCQQSFTRAGWAHHQAVLLRMFRRNTPFVPEIQ